MKRLSLKLLAGACALCVFAGAGTGMAHADEQMKIATATTTGAFYPIGGVMASILSRKMDGYNFTAEATGGSVENSRLLHTGQDHIAFVGADTFYEANNGQGAFKGRPIKLDALAKLYGNPFHIVALQKSGIKTLSDLDGKTIAVGAPGSGTSNKARLIFDAVGLHFGQEIEPRFLSFREGTDALTDGRVDAVVISVGLPSGDVQEVGARHKINLVNFTPEDVKKISSEFPFFEGFTIPEDTYDAIDHDTQTVLAPNYLVVAPGMDEDVAYNITKTLFGDSLDEIKNSHAAMKDVKLDELPKTNMPLHPGAKRFYKEQNVLQ